MITIKRKKKVKSAFKETQIQHLPRKKTEEAHNVTAATIS